MTRTAVQPPGRRTAGPPGRRAAVTRPALLALLVLATALGHAGAQSGSAVQAPGYGALDFTPPPAGSYRLPPLGAAGDGELLLADGGAARLHSLLDGRYTLLSFFYTRCGELNGCPLAAHVLQRTLRRLRQEPEVYRTLDVLSISFDPQHDTPDTLARYGRWFSAEHPNWRFATAPDEAALAPLLAGYGQNRIVERGDNGAPTQIYAHTLRVFLIDRQRRIRNVYSTAFLHPEVLLNDLRTLRLAPADDGVSELSPRTTESAAVAAAGFGLPDPPVPTAAADPAVVELGRKLFFDRRLSHNGTLSCAMCHIPAQGFSNHEMATAVGIEGRTVRRNAPTLLNVGYLRRLFHDGRERSLENQAWQPLLARNEMGNPSVGVVLERLETLADYAGRFERALGRGPDMAAVGTALAAYQRSLVAANSTFDRWYYGGDENAVGADVKRGFTLFQELGCAGCHRVGADGALFSDERYHNTGVGWYASMRPEPATRRVRLAPGVYADVASALINSAAETPPNDLGRYEITLDPADRWRYRTPTLRNVALTAPYMHDGSLATLADVIDYYDRGGYANPGLDPRVRPLGLDQRQQADLLALLYALSADPAALAALTRPAPIGDVGVGRLRR